MGKIAKLREEFVVALQNNDQGDLDSLIMRVDQMLLASAGVGAKSWFAAM